MSFSFFIKVKNFYLRCKRVKNKFICFSRQTSKYKDNTIHFKQRCNNYSTDQALIHRLKTFCFLISFLGCIFLLVPFIALGVDYTIPQIRIYSENGSRIESSFLAFDEGFKGGADISVGDLNGDGRAEIIIGAGPGGGPHLRVFDSRGNFTGLSFFPFHQDFRGGIDVASCDFDEDNRSEIIVSQKSQGQAWVKVYKINNEREYVLSNFLAYDENFEGGAHVACGDVNGDKKAEIVTGAGFSGGPHVRIFRYDGQVLGPEIFPYPLDYRGGVDVATGDVDAKGVDEIICVANKFATSRVKVYRADSQKTILSEFVAFPESFQGGANVALGDLDMDGQDEIIVSASSGGGPQVLGFEYNGRPTGLNFFAYDQDFRGGVKTAVADVDYDQRPEIISAPSLGFEKEKIIGYSWQGQPIRAYFFGFGPEKILFIGGLHSGIEPNSVQLMERWISYLGENEEVIPSSRQVIVIPNVNPDGLSLGRRENSHGVDLNRNFGARNWRSFGQLWLGQVYGGPFAFSERESSSLANFILEERPRLLISYHSAAGQIFVPKIGGWLHAPSLNLAKIYNSHARYKDKYDWEFYEITGDLPTWSVEILGIPAITVELSTGWDIDWLQNLPAMLAMLYLRNERGK